MLLDLFALHMINRLKSTEFISFAKNSLYVICWIESCNQLKASNASQEFTIHLHGWIQSNPGKTNIHFRQIVEKILKYHDTIGSSKHTQVRWPISTKGVAWQKDLPSGEKSVGPGEKSVGPAEKSVEPDVKRAVVLLAILQLFLFFSKRAVVWRKISRAWREYIDQSSLA